jgi:hypothetical protein
VRFIPTLIHATVDYIVGLLLIGLPLLVTIDGPARALTMSLGLFVLLYSLATDYELGVIRFLRIRLHLFLDALSGAILLLLAVAADLPGPARWPYYVIGALALFLSATTRTRAQGTAGE